MVKTVIKVQEQIDREEIVDFIKEVVKVEKVETEAPLVPLINGKMEQIGIVVGAVISFLFTWNEYTFSQILATGFKATTIAALIAGFLNEVPEPGHLAASIIYSMIPPFVVVFLLQKHIAKMHIVEPLG